MIHLFHRLRTQLIISHLIAIACTLIAMVTAVVLIAGSWFASQRSTYSGPAQQAQLVAGTIAGLVSPGEVSPDLNGVLRSLSSGGLRIATTPWAATGWWRYHQPDPGTALQDVTYLAVVSPGDQLLASSQPAGSAFAPGTQKDWSKLVQAVLAKPDNPQTLVQQDPPGKKPETLSAAPVLDNNGQPVAVVVLASQAAPQAASGSSLLGSLLFAAEASAVLLAASSIFALISAGLVGYLLSRRLVHRLEVLGGATNKLARGDLAQRVEEGPADEVGQLARGFNEMAERLAETVSSLTEARQRTEAALAAKRELVANVSHELRTPLALIRGYVETLDLTAEAGEPAQIRAYLSIVERETENLSRLIDDLFTLSTAETNALSLNLEPVDLGALVQEVGISLQPLAYRERRISVVTRIEADLPPAIADHQRFVQVLGNLARNSLRHTTEGGLIALEVERQGDWISVSVEDTGEGIPAERLAHIFERFYRGDPARDRESGGAGLGLAIVRELVEAMGGDVSVESQVGQGSRFSVRLGIAQEIDWEPSMNGTRMHEQS